VITTNYNPKHIFDQQLKQTCRSSLLTVDLQCLLVNGQFLLLSVVPA